MSSGFVSGGTIDEAASKDDEWLKAQQEVEANRGRKAEQEASQAGGQSLYDVLQANKAAKQEAFEESRRLKNQFRSLDEDEVDFLDSVLDSTRAKEAAIKKETTEQLEAFRKHREEAERAAIKQQQTEELADGEEQWAVGKKRKKGPEKGLLKGVKLRRTSSAEVPATASTSPPPATSPPHRSPETSNTKNATTPASARKLSPPTTREPAKVVTTAPEAATTTTPPPPAGLGLDYSSDEED